MKRENIVVYRVDINDCDNPHKFFEDLKPVSDLVDSAYIPVTVSDNIYFVFELQSEQTKEKYLQGIKILNPKCYGSSLKKETKAVDFLLNETETLKTIERFEL